MDRFKNIHEGDRVFILGTGPSLNETPFDELKNEFTIALGQINLIYDQTEWRPTYYVSYDFAIEEYMNSTKWGHQRRMEYVKAHLDSDTTLFLSQTAKQYFGDQSDVYYYNWEKKSGDARRRAIKTGDISEIWSNDISNIIYNFGGTMSVAPQIANYMGFDEIYFIGCDLFKEERPYMIFKDANDPAEYVIHDSTIQNYFELVSGGSPAKSTINAVGLKIYKTLIPKSILSDNNHFSKKYQPHSSVNAQKKNKDLSDVHRVVKLASNKYDFDAYNATIGGYLEVYDRVNIHELLKNK